MKNKTFYSKNSKNNGQKKTCPAVPALHRITEIELHRKPIDTSLKLEVYLMDLLPMGVNLTANELKVWIVLRAFVVGRSNLSAIDQEQLSALTAIARPNVARAIAGLRTKGMILRTSQQLGEKLYRNIYSLWSSPKQLEKESKQLSQPKNSQKLSQSSPSLPKNSLQKSPNLKKPPCIYCKDLGVIVFYVPNLDLDRGKWCLCPIGLQKAKLKGLSHRDFLPEHILKEYL